MKTQLVAGEARSRISDRPLYGVLDFVLAERVLIDVGAWCGGTMGDVFAQTCFDSGFGVQDSEVPWWRFGNGERGDAA